VSKEITKKAVEMLLKGATLVSDPCPYCKGVRVIKDGHALCVNCGREAKDENVPVAVEVKKPDVNLALTKFEQKLQDLAKELEQERDYEKQHKILKSISELTTIIDKLKK